MNYLKNRILIGIFLSIGSIVIVFLSKYGDIAELVGSIIFGILLAISVFFLVGGTLGELKNNKDRRGVKYSWKNTFTGIAIFVISIPLVIWFTFYLFGYL